MAARAENKPLPRKATAPRRDEVLEAQTALEAFWSPSASRGTKDDWWACHEALTELDLTPGEVRLLRHRLPKVDHWTVKMRVVQLEAMLDELEGDL